MFKRWIKRWQHQPLSRHQREQAAFWLPVSPVHLIADRDTLILIPPQLLQLSVDEAAHLTSQFNEHFAEQGYLIIQASASDWWLGANHRWHIHFPPLHQLASANIRHALEGGEDARKWRRLLNEAQMLWHTNPVNQQREDSGHAVINGFWVI